MKMTLSLNCLERIKIIQWNFQVFDVDVDEVGGSSIMDLDSDVSKLKEYATGKKPTLKEFVQNKKRKDKAKAISEDPEAQSDAVIRRQGEAQDYDYDDYASGGIAGMLGE